QDLDHVFMRF
uniref:Myosuppressin n=1 Tax=Rhodnius prolixus TaxID=13249 RepID=NEMS_RHOPR|nr:RecName: Full=Myosuppressin; Short=Rhopr-MS [Rhodnius prolixus]